MALETADPPAAPGAQVVANAFVEQYYHILHHSPELVHRFYQDSSVLSRQEENGEMTSVTTMQGINAKILSLDYTNYKAEIKTADAQESYKDGVIVLVTGCLTGKDNLTKKFAQSFFLAPQAKGYFVLNDVFRYVSECEPLDPKVVMIEKLDDSADAQSAVVAETCHALDTAAPDVARSPAIGQVHVEKTAQIREKERQVSTEEGTAAVSQSPENNMSVDESSQMSPREDGVKNSYASIVKAKSSPGRTKVKVPSYAVRSTSINTHKPSSGPVAPVSDAQSTVNNEKAPENLIAQEEVEGHSIHVRNLPLSMTDSQLEEEFKRFGQIKPGGVQVRSNKLRGSCYGFVEFLSASSMESAIQASPLSIGGRKAFVEIKRTTTRVDGGQGRHSSGRGGFRSDSFRGRGSHGGGRGFSSNDTGGQGEYYGQGSGRGGRGGEGYQRGRGRAGRGTIRLSTGRETF